MEKQGLIPGHAAGMIHSQNKLILCVACSPVT